MNRILTAVAADEESATEIAAAADIGEPGTDAEVVCASAAWAADRAQCRAIIAATQSGGTANAVARNRPSVPIVAVTPNEQSARQMALSWGVKELHIACDETFESLSRDATAAVKENMGLGDDDRILLVAGIPSGVKGGTNTMKIIRVGKEC